MSRVVPSAIFAVLLLALLWMFTAALGRIATVRGLLEHFQEHSSWSGGRPRPPSVVDDNPTAGPMRGLIRLNFLRAVTALAALVGFIGAAILAGFASPDANPHTGRAFLLFVPIAAFVSLAWYGLNWWLQLASMFAVRDRLDAIPAISAAVRFCRDRAGAVAAVSVWTTLAHITAFACAMTAISMPLGFAAIVPWRPIAFVMILMTLAYFALADWLYTARLAGYVCIAETPEALLKPPLRPMQPPPPEPNHIDPAAPTLQTTIDQNEVIFSDVPLNSPDAFYVHCEMCITCRAPEAVAPDLIGFFEDLSGTARRSHCYFKKQPETPAELEQAVTAVGANCCGTYHYAGSDPAIQEKLKEINCASAIDNPN